MLKVNNHQPKKDRRARPGSGKKRELGFSLLEALISILVLSVGALGVAGLQVISLKNSKSADARGRAASFALQMADDIALRPALAQAQSSDVLGSVSNTACTGTGSTPIEIWRIQLDCAIPGASGGATYDRIANRLVVTVQWDDSKGLDGSATQQFVVDTRL